MALHQDSQTCFRMGSIQKDSIERLSRRLDSSRIISFPSTPTNSVGFSEAPIAWLAGQLKEIHSSTNPMPGTFRFCLEYSGHDSTTLRQENPRFTTQYTASVEETNPISTNDPQPYYEDPKCKIRNTPSMFVHSTFVTPQESACTFVQGLGCTLSTTKGMSSRTTLVKEQSSC
jgi:hypothetical protein